MKLYSYWRSTAAYRVRIALAHKKLKYETFAVDLVKDGGEQHAEPYLSINPNQLVPTLVDNDKVITQSTAIIEYLEECYPQYPLLPEAPGLRAKIRALSQIIACDVHPLNNLRVLQFLKTELSQPQQQLDNWYQHWIITGFKAIEKNLQQTSNGYCFSNQLSLADVFLVPQVYNANRFKVALDAFPMIKAINHKCLGLSEFQQALPENQADAKS